jgi:hypothetical protein
MGCSSEHHKKRLMKNIIIGSSTSLIIALSFFAHFHLVSTVDHFPQFTKLEGTCDHARCTDIIALAKNKKINKGGTVSGWSW